MAVSSSISTLPTIDEYLLAAYKKAGLLPLQASIGYDNEWNAMAAHGRTTLNRLVEGLAVEGFLDHFQAFEVVTLTAGDGTYTLDSDILNVVDTGSYIPASNAAEVEETVGETPVSPMSIHQWNGLSTKNATGTPTRYFLHRNASSLEIHLWPLPDEAGKIRFRVHRIPGSNSTGSDNVDLKRHWGNWIVHALAYEFMSDAKLALDERALCRQDRDEYLAKVKAYDTSNEPPDLYFCHSTPWSNF
jgi:hypothetical protein